MQAAVLTEDGFVMHDIPRPVVGDDEVLIRTSACGICSGDVYVYHERQRLAARNSMLGHEASGVIVDVGRNVHNFAPGDVVTALGMPAYADYYTTLAMKVVKLPPEVHPVYAVGEAVACCVHAAGRFGTRPGDRIALLGCGFMGLVSLQLARLQQAGFICAFDLIEERRQMSLQLGADAAVDPSLMDNASLLARYGEFDVVIEATGSQSALDLGTTLVRQHGRLILIGYHQSHRGERVVNMQQWNFKGIDVINAHVRLQDEKAEALRAGMDLLASGKLTTKPLVTPYRFADTERAFHELDNRKPGLYKAVVVMDGTLLEGLDVA